MLTAAIDDDTRESREILEQKLILENHFDVFSEVQHETSDVTVGILDQNALLCLESSTDLGVLQPQQKKSTNLHYIALREGLLDLSQLFIHDKTDNFLYRSRWAHLHIVVELWNGPISDLHSH